MDCRCDKGIGRVQIPASEASRSLAEAIAALRARRDRYRAAGKLIQARTVERCLAILRG